MARVKSMVELILTWLVELAQSKSGAELYIDTEW